MVEEHYTGRLPTETVCVVRVFILNPGFENLEALILSARNFSKTLSFGTASEQVFQGVGCYSRQRS